MHQYAEIFQPLGASSQDAVRMLLQSGLRGQEVERHCPDLLNDSSVWLKAKPCFPEM